MRRRKLLAFKMRCMRLMSAPLTPGRGVHKVSRLEVWKEVRKPLIGLGLVLSVVGILVQFYTAIDPIYRAFLSGLTPAGGITLVLVELYAAKDRRQGKLRNEELKRELNTVKISPLVVDQCSAWMLGYYMVICEAGQGPRIGYTAIS